MPEENLLGVEDIAGVADNRRMKGVEGGTDVPASLVEALDCIRVLAKHVARIEALIKDFIAAHGKP